MGCRPGACASSPGRPRDGTLDSLWRRARSAICRIIESFKVTIEFDDITATKFLMHPCSAAVPTGLGSKRARARSARPVCLRLQWPQPWAWGARRAARPRPKFPNSSLLEVAVYAMDALAVTPRANAQQMELHKENVAQRAILCVSGQKRSCAKCALIAYVNISCTMIYVLVTCSPCHAPSSSCYLNRRTYTT